MRSPDILRVYQDSSSKPKTKTHKNQNKAMKTPPKSLNSLTSLVTTMIHKPEPPKAWPCADRPAGLRRSALLRLAFIVNSLADSPSETELPLPAVHAAAQEGRLLELLAQSAGRYPDFPSCNRMSAALTS